MNSALPHLPTPHPLASEIGLLGRIWREAARPFRVQTWRKWAGTAPRQPRLLDLSLQPGSVEPEGLAFLAQLVTRSRQFPGPIIEIGTLFGRTAVHMALCKGPDQKIVTVDKYVWNPWGLTPQSHFQLTSHVLHYLVQTGQVEQLNMDKALFYATYRGPAPSLVFLDATHNYSETKKDIDWARSAGAALIAGHDYSDKFPGVKQIVDEYGGPQELGATVFLL
jgi:hypothetical protein